jgi:hypothetical protein
MKTLLLATAAIGVIATTLPAASQEFRFRAGPDGVAIGRDDDRYDRYRDRRVIERRVYRDRYDDDDDCRTVTTRRYRPDGSVVVRRERRCS